MWEFAQDFLMSEAGFNLLLAFFGTIFTAIMGTDRVRGFLKEKQIEKLENAWKHLEAAVAAQRDKVSRLKAENGGHLSDEQKDELEKEVINALVAEAKKTGFDALAVIGPELIRPAIIHVVRRLKGKMAIKDATALPSDVAAMFPSTDK